MTLDWWAESERADFDSSYWLSSWEAVSEPDTVYIKIDDDVLFIEDGAIESMVKRLVGNPDFFGVSANIINGAALSWVHGQMGVYEPYWPEMDPPGQKLSKSGLGPDTAHWRPSDYPYHEGLPDGPKEFIFDGSTPAPHPGHRWLRLPPETSYNISATPATTLTFDAWGPSVRNWAAGAQSHYSFLQHLEQGDTWRYKFNIWDYNFQRLALNFIAFRGEISWTPSRFLQLTMKSS
ncbi:hypothetical protein Ct61P_09835 [Colletotrichum tofieldiae]|nr:hypothetical protein Ct61P_09835 [Colletotrichum tofieldiae]